ncbi:MAG: magnesium transporter MgtE N-terminal domain-containing protein, partial [Candidatus Saccharimonadales bacterium]
MVYKFHFPTTARANRKRLRELAGALVSVAGLVGKQVKNQDGQDLGKVVDLVCRWDNAETYPPLTGLIMRVGRQQVWVPAASVGHISSDEVRLGNAKMDLRDFQPREGEIRLFREVSDHQLIDVDGARVVRASDLYVAEVSGVYRLVGIDVGFKPLLRRLTPSRISVKPVPDAVVDWATIQSFVGNSGTRQLKLSANRQELRRMRPGELADMLEDLGRLERRELLNALTPELAADALEEMEPNELEAILRESSPQEVSEYLSRMEP